MDKDIFSPEEELDDDAFLASLEDLLKEPEETAKPQQEEPPKPQPEKKHNRNKKWEKALVCGVLALAVAGGGIFAFLTLKDPYHRKIVDGVSFGTVDLSNMTKGQAKKALNAAYKNPTMTVSFPDFGLPLEESGSSVSLSCLSITPDGAGAYVDTAGALQAAYAVGRTEEAQGVTAIPFADFLTLDTQALRQNVANFEEQLQSYTVPHTAYLEGDKPDVTDSKAVPQTLVITPSQAGPKIDGDTLYEDLLAAYQAGNLSCTYSGSVTKTTPELADLQSIYDENCYAAQEPSIDKQTLEVTPGKRGYEFDVADATKRMRQQGNKDLRIPLTITQPTISDDDVYFQDILGHCETPYSNNPKRIVNLGLACKALDGLILQPGQEFSYNDTLGERTAEKGYQPAPAYSGTTLVDSLGGGICQVSSTLYLASVYAELTILERVNHGYPVHYIPYGMDATVNWGFTDLKMRNDSDLPVKIHAEESDGYVRVEILGTETRNYDIEMSYSVGGRYVKTFMTKKDKETGEVISKEPVALSAYMEDVFQ